jgi:transposase
MPKTSKFLDSAVVSTAKKELQKLGPYGYVSKKLLAVIASSEHGIGEVAKIYGVSRNTITEWIKHIKHLNLEKLKAPEERCKPHKLDKEQMLQVKVWIESDSSITSRALMIKIKEFYDIDVSITTAYRIIKRLNYSYITPRPMHYKQNKDKAEEFKKKSYKEDTKEQ